MGIKYFNIEYDRPVFYPGQLVSGRVRLSLDKPKEMRAVELSLSGKAKCHWTKNESYRDAEGKTQWRDVSCDGKETYFKTNLKLVGGGQKFELPIGDYVYPFSVSLPAVLPPSYSGTYGSITYCGKAKLDLPWAADKSEKRHFIVENPIDLNRMPELNRAYKNENSKTFCCWCCASGPLTISVYIPRTGFVCGEAIPITIEVENASNVDVNSVKIELNQIINWKATNDSKEEKTTMKSRKLDGVEKDASRTWTEDFELGPNKYPNCRNCGIIKIKYELKIELDVSGPHSNLDLKTSITIGDIAFGDSQPDAPPTGVGFIPPQSEMPPASFGYNPGPVGFTATYPSNTGTPYPGGAGTPYPGGTGAPYPGGAGAPYPGSNGAPYPGATGAPYPGATGAPHLGAAGTPYPGAAGAPYPGAPSVAAGAPFAQNTPHFNSGVSYPGATSTPNASAPYSQPAYAPPQTHNMYSDASFMRTVADAPSAAETNLLLEHQ